VGRKRIKKTVEQKAAERLGKLSEAGQYVGGNYFTRAGVARVLGYWQDGEFVEPEGGHEIYFEARPIDAARINQYSGLWMTEIRTHFPAMCVYGAGWDIDDLQSECRNQVFKALLDTFDPGLAMMSRVDEAKTAKDRLKRYEWEKEMAKDIPLHLAVTERGWVKTRLENFLRRTQYNFHPQQLGGRAQSLDAIIEETVNAEVNTHLVYEATPLEEDAQKKVDELLLVLQELGPQEAKTIFLSMGRSDREDILAAFDRRYDPRNDLLLNEEALQEATATDSADRIRSPKKAPRKRMPVVGSDTQATT
jgi:hypothetical protein